MMTALAYTGQPRRAGWSGSAGMTGALRDDPLDQQLRRPSDDVEVAVVVQHGRPVFERSRCDDQVREWSRCADAAASSR